MAQKWYHVVALVCVLGGMSYFFSNSIWESKWTAADYDDYSHTHAPNTTPRAIFHYDEVPNTALVIVIKVALIVMLNLMLGLTYIIVRRIR